MTSMNTETAEETSVAALRARIRALESQVSAREQARRELTALYEAQSAYLDQRLVSWSQTPFARRIAELEAELGL